MNTIDIIRSSAFTIDDFEQATEKLRDAMNLSNNITPAGALHPILVSTPLIHPIWRGDKTMTRRIVKDGVPIGNWEETLKHCPYKVGDVLWVKETFFAYGQWKSIIGYGLPTRVFHDLTRTNNYPHKYFADWSPNKVLKMGELGWHKRPSLFMHKAVARIFLQVTDIKMERLNDISDEDCEKEGIEIRRDQKAPSKKLYLFYPCNDLRDHTYIDNPKTSFYSLWTSINKKGAWERNPWVWVYTFKVVERPANFITTTESNF